MIKYWHVGMDIFPPTEGTYKDVEYWGASDAWVPIRTFPLWASDRNVIYRYKEII